MDLIRLLAGIFSLECHVVKAVPSTTVTAGSLLEVLDCKGEVFKAMSNECMES